MVLPVCFWRRIQLETKSLPAKPAFSYHNSPVTVAVNKRKKNTCQCPSSFTSFLLRCLVLPVRAGMGYWHPVLALRHPQSLSPPRLKWTLVPEPPWLGQEVCQVPRALILYCDCHQSNFPKMATALFPVFIFPCAFPPPQHLDTPYEERGSVPSPLEPGWDFAQP